MTGNFVRKIRKEKIQTTIEDFADILGVTPRTIINLENCKDKQIPRSNAILINYYFEDFVFPDMIKDFINNSFKKLYPLSLWEYTAVFLVKNVDIQNHPNFNITESILFENTMRRNHLNKTDATDIKHIPSEKIDWQEEKYKNQKVFHFYYLNDRIIKNVSASSLNMHCIRTGKEINLYGKELLENQNVSSPGSRLNIYSSKKESFSYLKIPIMESFNNAFYKTSLLVTFENLLDEKTGKIINFDEPKNKSKKIKTEDVEKIKKVLEEEYSKELKEFITEFGYIY